MPSHRLSDLLPDLPDHQSSSRRRPRNPDEYESHAAPTPLDPPEPLKASAKSNADSRDGRPSWHHDGEAESAPKTGANGGGDRSSDVPDVIMAEASPSPPTRSTILPPPPAIPQGNASASSSKLSASPCVRSPLRGGSPVSVGLTSTGATTAPLAASSVPRSSPYHHNSLASTSRSTPVTPQKGLPLDSRVAALSKSAGSKSLKTGKSPKKSSMSISTLPPDLQKMSGTYSPAKQSTSSKVDSPNQTESSPLSTSPNTPSSAARATREPFSMNWPRAMQTGPRTMQTARKPPVFATKPPVLTPNMVQAKANGTASTSANSNGMTQAASDTPLVPRSIIVPVKRKSTSDAAAQDVAPPASPATAGATQTGPVQSPTARIPTVLPKCLSDLRTDLEALWLSNQPRIIQEFGSLQRTALAVQNERDAFQQQLTTAEEDAETTKVELATAKGTIAGLGKTLQAERVNNKRADTVVSTQRSELAANKVELDANKVELERVERNLMTVQTQLEQSTSEVQAAKKQAQTVEKERDTLRVQLLQTTSEAQATKTKIGAVEKEKENLQTALTDAQRRNQVLEQANQQFVRERIQNRNESDKRAESDKVRHEADIKTFQSINDDLYKEIADTQQRAEREVKAERDRAANLSTANVRLQEEVSLAKRALGNKIEALAQVKADHAKALQEAQAKLLSMQSQLGRARSTDSEELQKWKQKANKAMHASNEKTLEFSNMQTEQVRLSEVAKARLDEIEKLRRLHNEREEQIRAKDHDHDQLVKKHETLVTQSEAMRKEIKARNKAREALDREVEARKKADEVHKAELEPRNKICKALRRDVEDRNKQIQSRNKAYEAAQKQSDALQKQVETLQKDAEAQASEYQELERENESLQVEMSLRGKVTAPEVDMEALEKRIREEEAQKLAAEVKELGAAKNAELQKLRAEKEAEAQRLANEITKLEAQNAQLVSTSKVLGKRSRHEPRTEQDWRKYAEEVSSTFFDLEGVCIACRRGHKSNDSPVVPLYSDSRSQSDHVWTVHRSILEKHREETRKVSKRLKRESVRAGDMSAIVPSDRENGETNLTQDDIFGGSQSELTDITSSADSDTDEDAPLYRQRRSNVITVDDRRAGYPVNRESSPPIQGSFCRKKGARFIPPDREQAPFSYRPNVAIGINPPLTGRKALVEQPPKHPKPISFRFGGIGESEERRQKSVVTGSSQPTSAASGPYVASSGEVLRPYLKKRKRTSNTEADSRAGDSGEGRKTVTMAGIVGQAQVDTNGVQKKAEKGKEKRVEQMAVPPQYNGDGRILFLKPRTTANHRSTENASNDDVPRSLAVRLRHAVNNAVAPSSGPSTATPPLPADAPPPLPAGRPPPLPPAQPRLVVSASARRPVPIAHRNSVPATPMTALVGPAPNEPRSSVPAPGVTYPSSPVRNDLPTPSTQRYPSLERSAIVQIHAGTPKAVYRPPQQITATNSRVSGNAQRVIRPPPHQVQTTSDQIGEVPFNWGDEFREMQLKMQQSVDDFQKRARASESWSRARVESLEREARQTGEELRIFRETVARDKAQSLRDSKASRKQHAATKKALEEEKKRSDEAARFWRAEMEGAMESQRGVIVHAVSEAIRQVRIRQGYRLALADASQKAQATASTGQRLKAELKESLEREDALKHAAAAVDTQHKTELALIGIQHADDMRQAVEEESARKAAELQSASRLTTDDLESKIRGQAAAMKDLQDAELSFRLNVAKTTENFKAKIKNLENANQTLRIDIKKHSTDEKYWNQTVAKVEKEKDEWREKFEVLRSQGGSLVPPPDNDEEDDDIVVLEEDPKLTESKRLAAARRPDPPATQSPSHSSGSQSLPRSQSARVKKRSRTAETFDEKTFKAIAEKVHLKWFTKEMICIFCSEHHDTLSHTLIPIGDVEERKRHLYQKHMHELTVYETRYAGKKARQGEELS
ncbi:hypothetical protein QFC21_001355 [Naganishia friedmannii]|uniref:Uncharacterized protein n=1 Tax=Naganishia friedmannii TaxID=89922 RepID=A0ACC2W5S0_9TREE|nr:hypothetical protein QFC21_001355 [Naganishia friedmannii]